ncbi:MAG: DNA/RNA nuclease SfsA [Mailhella sp.]|nr:DNA/RNA nuclease SfsA [Mailhella sp.]
MNGKTILLSFPRGCTRVVFVRREKRFFAICRDPHGNEFAAHTNNTGSMTGLLPSKGPLHRLALLSPAASPKRVLQWTLEAVSLGRYPTADPDAFHEETPVRWAGVNTSVPNRILRAAFFHDRSQDACDAPLLPWAAGYTHYKGEARHEESRLDALLTDPGGKLRPLWVECKNVSLCEDGGAAYFPDAVSERGAKHLGTLQKLAGTGCRAAMLFVVQHPDASCFAPADFIDAEYADKLGEAARSGVEIYALGTRINEQGVSVSGYLPVKV